jgi:hypothetical protein
MSGSRRWVEEGEVGALLKNAQEEAALKENCPNEAALLRNHLL